MSIITIVIILFCIGKLIDSARVNAQNKQIERVKLEQKRAQEWQRAKAREDAEIAKEVARVAKEQAKQAAQIAKHDDMIRKVTHDLEQIKEDLPLFYDKLEKYTKDMDRWQDKLRKAQLDLEWDELRMREAPSAVKGKEHDDHIKARDMAENKIISLKESIRKVEKQIATAEFNRGEYERKLSA